jgi:hypothetical protein
MMFLMVYLYTALEIMQNGLRTCGIGCESMEMRFWCMRFYFINFVDENDFLERIHLPQMLSGCEKAPCTDLKSDPHFIEILRDYAGKCGRQSRAQSV